MFDIRPPRVCVLTSDPVVAGFLTTVLLGGHMAYRVVDTPSSLGPAVSDLNPDVVLADARTPGTEFRKIISEVRASCGARPTPIVFLVDRDDDPAALGALLSGADGLLRVSLAREAIIVHLSAWARMSRQVTRLMGAQTGPMSFPSSGAMPVAAVVEIPQAPPALTTTQASPSEASRESSPAQDESPKPMPEFRGSLSSIGISHVLLMLEAEALSGNLLLTHDSDITTLEICGGTVTSVISGGIKLAVAAGISAIIEWRDGLFAFFRAEGPLLPRPAHLPTISVLLTAARRLREVELAAAGVPMDIVRDALLEGEVKALMTPEGGRLPTQAGRSTIYDIDGAIDSEVPTVRPPPPEPTQDSVVSSSTGRRRPRESTDRRPRSSKPPGPKRAPASVRPSNGSPKSSRPAASTRSPRPATSPPPAHAPDAIPGMRQMSKHPIVVPGLIDDSDMSAPVTRGSAEMGRAQAERASNTSATGERRNNDRVEIPNEAPTAVSPGASSSTPRAPQVAPASPGAPAGTAAQPAKTPITKVSAGTPTAPTAPSAPAAPTTADPPVRTPSIVRPATTPIGSITRPATPRPGGAGASPSAAGAPARPGGAPAPTAAASASPAIPGFPRPPTPPTGTAAQPPKPAPKAPAPAASVEPRVAPPVPARPAAPGAPARPVTSPTAPTTGAAAPRPAAPAAPAPAPARAATPATPATPSAASTPSAERPRAIPPPAPAPGPRGTPAPSPVIPTTRGTPPIPARAAKPATSTPTRASQRPPAAKSPNSTRAKKTVPPPSEDELDWEAEFKSEPPSRGGTVRPKRK